MKTLTIVALLNLSACSTPDEPSERRDEPVSAFVRCPAGHARYHAVSPSLPAVWHEAVAGSARAWSLATRGCAEMNTVVWDEADSLPEQECVTRWNVGPTEDGVWAQIDGHEVTIGEEARELTDRDAVGAIAMHEMGHTLGLGDVRDREALPTIMWWVPSKGQPITEVDGERAREQMGCR